MNWVDLSILAIIGVSVVFSVTRGFTREALSLAGWIIAFWVAISFSEPLEALLINQIPVPGARLAVAFALLFFCALLLAGLINFLAVQLIKRTGLDSTDRMVGIFFGMVRGVVVVAVLVLLGGFFSLAQEPWWGESALLHYFEDLALWMRMLLPPETVANIHSH